MTHQEFIEKIADYVEKYAYVYGILVHSPIIAQAILESAGVKAPWPVSTITISV